LLIQGLPNIETGRQLGTITNDVYSTKLTRLTQAIAQTYPGASSSLERNRKK